MPGYFKCLTECSLGDLQKKTFPLKILKTSEVFWPSQVKPSFLRVPCSTELLDKIWFNLMIC